VATLPFESQLFESSLLRLPRCSMLQPVRDHFASGEPKKLLEQVRSYKITR